MSHAAPPALHWFADVGDVPNNPALPVVILPAALPRSMSAADVRALFEANRWGGTWTWTVFDYHHYHPNAHEVLGVAAGAAMLMLGGPAGDGIEVSAGDVLVLPAGTGHCRLSASADFAVCGGYPQGQQNYETIRVDGPAPEGVVGRIAAVPLPETDPVHGRHGPVVRAWQGGDDA